MLFLYSLVIALYYVMIRIAALLGHDQARRWYDGRRYEPALKMPREWEGKNRIWIHSASYGEYEMAKPIVAKLLENPRNRLYISFFSPSGYENLHFDNPRIYKFYLPKDYRSRMLQCIENLAPTKVVFIKYEFWFNFLGLLQEKSIPYYFTSTHINRDSFMLKISAFQSLLKSATGLYCHNTDSAKILEDNGFNNIHPFGDTRINKALENLEKNIPKLQWIQSNNTIAYGSLLSSEVPIMVLMMKAFPDYNHLVAPHDIDSESMRKITSALETGYSLYSELERNKIPHKVLIINTLGDLKHLYADCAVAYVGGGFSKGPHSIIEPLAHGVQTVIGPHIKHYPMARHLKKEGYIYVIDTPNQLAECIEKIISTPIKTSQQIIEKIGEMNVTLDPLIEELSA